MIGIQFPVGAMMGHFLFATASRPALGPASFKMDTRSCYPWDKVAGGWNWPLTSI